MCSRRLHLFLCTPPEITFSLHVAATERAVIRATRSAVSHCNSVATATEDLGAMLNARPATPLGLFAAGAGDVHIINWGL